MPIAQSDKTELVQPTTFPVTATERWNLGAVVVFLAVLALATFIHLMRRAAGSW